MSDTAEFATSPERLLGYTDQICVAPGEAVEFKVSSPDARPFSAQLVRLRCADSSSGGPGFKEETLAAPFTGDYPGREQPIPVGSGVHVGDLPPLASFTVQLLVWPSLPGDGRQALLGTWDEAASAGWGLYLDESGAVAAQSVSATGEVTRLSTEVPLLARHWYRVTLVWNAELGELQLAQEPCFSYALGNYGACATARDVPPAAENHDLRMAHWLQHGLPFECFNGRLESPRLTAGVLSADEQQAQIEARDARALHADTIAAWDFGRDFASARVTDIGPHGLHGETFNLPTRAVRGSRWDGTITRFTDAPAHYAAIHFHDDDLYDCCWLTDFSYEVPEDLTSGLYAAKLSSAAGEEYLPFYVRPPRGTATADLALVIPTASYCAYANFHNNTEWDFAEQLNNAFTVLDPAGLYLHNHPELGISTYDTHTDGSGGALSSRLRPILNLRPHSWAWQFVADTHLLDWLEQQQIAVDVFTDEELHYEGAELLSRYRCVMSGTHPEYSSRAMLDAIIAYQQQGGRFMYMGGNGFYWRVDYNPAFPGVIEMRRAEDGSRGWLAEPGEYYQMFSGELGGMWRRNGIPPQRTAGTGFTAQGFDGATHYERTADSFNPRAAFIFEGIGDEELIGNFGAAGGGAAGWEVDRADFDLGTPPHALIVASATDFPVGYHWVKEEHMHAHAAITGDVCPHVRADMVFYETANGGAVFSTSSISWSAALCWNRYDNNVSRITENVLRRFLDPAPFVAGSA